MSRIAHEAERILHPHRQVDQHSQPRSRALAVTEAVTLGAARAADHLAADLVVVATRGGKTAMAVSRQRSHTPILGISDSPETTRRMCLYWGVTPLQSDKVNAPVQDLLKFIVDWCRKRNILHSGSKLVLVTSTNWSADGHDLMLVHAIP
jgi:pyruvate kinase